MSEKPEIDLTVYVLHFGKRHRGERIARVPASYLRWMVNSESGPYQVAKLELERRGSKIPTAEISGHAIDTASLRIRRQWHQNREKAEGLYSWLMRMCEEAPQSGRDLGDGAWEYKGVKWIIEQGAEWPLLKTVMPAKEDPIFRWTAVLDDQTCDYCRERHGRVRYRPLEGHGCSSDICRCVTEPARGD